VDRASEQDLYPRRAAVGDNGLMPRPLWNGSISFGLVNVPVKLFRCQSPQDVRFHQLHKEDGARVQQKRWCSAEDKEVPYDEIVKGYELSSDEYVIIDPDELSSLDPVATQTIDISDFVDLDQIDPIYFERAYYVSPGDRAAKPYSLLVAAMAESHKVAIAKFVMRAKEYLCAIRSVDGALVLETMYFADEIVSRESIDATDDELEAPKDKELKMAMQLIESLAGDFEPGAYVDEYRTKVMEMIDAKAAGNETVAKPEAEEKAPIVDLMAALEASLARASGESDSKDSGGETKGKRRTSA
jgi:DNA end-binding protein Ku